ncbi:MAG TPA: ribulose-phosphate 3-epimerase [Aggregatilinea sp.]|uniref:ribulose-phosphate 3-epimerase n=1 Tax=Aggregatilinea sp. TaxID=2806333 RepID=UPI002B9D668B|nr:ribulose-phosphate 3-epimerase [Aggregatilinea sp.]HML21939.1 ribulose-phosphate 3-epimerase [Aggregatilinea sp.]
MTLPVRISASLLAADFTRLGQQIEQAECAGVDWIHVDVMDGTFVPPISFGLPIIQAARRVTALPLDVHLMIVHPERHIEAMVDAGAAWVTVHYETCPHLHRVVQQIREAGAHPSVAINPATPVCLLDDILPFVDMVLVMTVNPGYGGQRFVDTTLRKIGDLRARIESLGREIEIEVDGGIHAGTAPDVVTSGASVLVAGTAIYGGSGSVVANTAALRESVLGETVR